ncbi:MAG: toprim domain-containing protein [Candidatus Bathyarchaeota archaeon]|nr:toprim domain-containing protein [Candidatus Bathyarchaeum tardum]WGM88645.1 MAG: toprim domain-containing protein [Candidatus Bathyarchaeum tardum]WNZ29096.1 MAG: toprim domain-containing protein [Candidatus Bathyarchaeota archaeon]
MSTKTEKRLEKIQNLLDRLEQKSAKGIPIVVEGKNDVDALRRLGISGELVLAKTSGKSFLDVQDEIEKTSKREIILLFDFDRRGKEWTNRLARCLEEMKITPNLVFWKMFLGLVGRDVKDIEGLASYVEHFK